MKGLSLLYKELIMKIIMEVSLIVTVLVVIFFTFGKGVEKTVVEEQSAFLVDNLKSSSDIIMPGAARLSGAFINTNVLSDSEIDTINSRNTQVESNAYKIFSAVTIGGMTLAFLFSLMFKLNFLSGLAESVVLVAFVGLVEILFLQYIGSRYILVDPGMVKNQIMKKILA